MIKALKEYKLVGLNTVYLSIMEIIHLAMPFVALPYIIKTVGADNYGKVVFSQTIASYFSITVNFGLDIIAAKDVAINRDNTLVLGKILGKVLTIKSIICASVFIIYTILIFSWSKTQNNIILYYSSFLICLTEIFFLGWLFQGLEKMFAITLIKTSSLVIYVILLYTIIKKEDQYCYIPALQSGALVLTSIIGCLYAIQKERIIPSFPQIKDIFGYFKKSIPFYFSRASGVINNSIATTVIGINLGDYQVATYDLAQKIARGSLTPVYMTTQATYPHNARHKNWGFARNVFLILGGTVLLGCITLFFAAPMVIKIVGDDKLPEAVPVLRVLIIYIMLGTCSVYLGTPTLVAWGYSKPFNNSVVLSTILIIGLYGILYILKTNTIFSYCFVLIITECFIVVYRLFYCLKYKIINETFLHKKGTQNE